jgi:DNA repair exonuclease SbcCD ATPase subunit
MEAEVAGAEQRAEFLRESWGEVKENLKSYDRKQEEERKKKETELTELTDKRHALEKRIKTARKNFESLEKQLEGIDEEIIPVESFEKIEKVAHDRGEAITALGYDVTALKSLEGSYKGALKKFAIGSECPECNRPFNASDIARYKERLRFQIESCQEDRKGLEKKIAKLRVTYETLKKQIDQQNHLMTKRHDTDLKKKDAELDLVSKGGEMKQILSDIKQVSSWQEQDAQVKSDYQKAVKKAQTEAKAAANEVKKLKEDADLLRQREMVLEFWRRGFSNRGIKDLIYNRSVDFHNDNLKTLTQRLTNGEMSIEFQKGAGDRIVIDVDIRKAADSYITASGGQSKRVDLCIALSFQKLVESGFTGINLSIFDEFDASLDSRGLGIFRNYLEAEAERKGTVFVISHNSELKEQFDQVLTVQHRDGESRVV